MNLTQNTFNIRSIDEDRNKLTLDHFSKQETTYFLRKSQQESHRRTHAKTFHVSDTRGQSISTYSQDSDNDIFKENYNQSVQKKESKSRSKSKVLQQYSYLTQKMMPDFEKNMNTISLIEGKAYQVNFNDQSNVKQIQTINEGEVLIKYNPDQHPIELIPDLVNIQTLRQQEFYYYKIKCRGEQIPLTFYMNQTAQTKFKIFLSTTNPFPSKFSCEQIYQVKTWKYKSCDQIIFRINYVFLSLICDLDTQIKLSFAFGTNLNTKISNKSPIKFKTTPDIINCTLTAAQILQKRKQQMLHLAKGRNIVQQNIMNITLQNDELFRAQRKETRGVQFRKIIENSKKRKYNEIAMQGQKEYNYYQKEITYMLRKQHNQIEKKKQNQQVVYFQWFLLMAIVNISQIIQKRIQFQHHLIKHVQIIQLKMKRIVHRVQRNIIKLKGVHIYDRAHLDIKFCLSIFCKSLYKKNESAAIQLVIPILQTRAIIWNFREKIQMTSAKINQIKDGIFEFVQRFRNYRNFVKQIFERNFDSQFIDSFECQNQESSQIALWYSQSRFILYFQLLANTFSKKFCKLRLRQYLQNVRKERLGAKAMKRSITKFNIELQKKSRLFIVPQPNDVKKLIPEVYALTKNQTELYCKEGLRKMQGGKKK